MKWEVGSGKWEKDEDVATRRLSFPFPTSNFRTRCGGFPPTSVIVNGDDFGYTAAINAAIVGCHDEGVLRSTSLLVNQPATRAALALARSRPSLGMGLHVNLTEGVPVLPPGEVPSLVDRRGRFRPFPAQLAGLARGRTNLAEVERELRAQFAILLDAGVSPTHVDGHLHAHAFPGVLPIVLRLLGEFGVRAMRSPLLAAWGRTEEVRVTWRGVRAFSMSSLAPLVPLATRIAPEAARERLLDNAGIVRAGWLCDAAHFLGAVDPALALADAVAAGGIVEVMAHPAWNRDARRGAAEVALLCDPRLPELLAERGVGVTHYGAL